MDFKNDFIEYYFRYLGIKGKNLEEGFNIILSEDRDKPISEKNFQYIICTKFGGKIVYSVSPRFYSRLCNHKQLFKLYTFDSIIESLQLFSKGISENLRVRRMYRLTIRDKINSKLKENKEHCVLKLTKEIIFDYLQFENNEEQKNYWERKKEIIEQGRQYIVVNDRKIIGWCKLSDIYYRGANIVVWIDPNYRRNGYGKEVVKRAINWCIENDYIPVYWVDSTNIPSVKLAKSLGLEIAAEEIVIST